MIPKVVVAGLAASISPVAVIALISVVMKKKARRNSILFLSGFILVLIVIGIAGLSAFNAGGIAKKGSKVGGYADVTLGTFCFLAIPLVIRQRKEKKHEPKEEIRAMRVFLLGSVTMLLNESTAFIYISGVREISAAKVGGDAVILLALLTVITLLTLLIPIMVLFASPSNGVRSCNDTFLQKA
ncbi:MAG: GAP family protein [Actinomycetota bacterium]|nr:GAP family protein [Actinomycetota bacterium]